ncbi:hypothetical protein AB4K20DRAFT_1801382 [Rhizopus microsporus]|uniref:OTU domain-containing protein n=1 Tax=Rhizopus microsporus TaxID=58291 RepID=A0A1X0RKV8_RHIZD|nr:hypothetical protein BCV71DRAFT_239983 [Rhizopus microsporus]
MYKQTRIYGRIPYLVQKVHSFVLDCILYELLEIQESKFEITYIETCHCAKQWQIQNMLNKNRMIMNIVCHIIEAKELEVQKIKVVEEDVCEKPKMLKNKKLRKLTQTDSQSEVGAFDLSTVSDTVPLLEEEGKDIKVESFLQDDTAEDTLSVKKTSLGSRLLFHKINPFNTVSSTATLSNFIKALKLFESFASTQDKQDMIDSFEKAIAEKQAKNLNNIRIKLFSVLDIKDSQKSKMTLVLNTIADGNCGFRCIAHAIYGDENFRMRAKREMKEWFDLHKHGIYKVIHSFRKVNSPVIENKYTHDKMNIADAERILSNYDPAPPLNCWLTLWIVRN